MQSFIEYSKSNHSWDPNYHWFVKCGAHLQVSGCYFASALADTILGIFAGLGTFLSAGEAKWPKERMVCHLKNGSRALLADPFSYCIMAIHQRKPFNDITTSLVGDSLVKGARGWSAAYRDSPNKMVKHISSRLCYTISLVAVAIVRAMEVSIGAIAAIFSLLTLGQINSLNTIAYRGLCGTAFLYDSFFFLTKIINPWAKIA